ncbi:MAG: DUF485 domain-containing protein [Thermodesulfobacteriota bacterium]
MTVEELRKKQLKFALAFGIPYFAFILGVYFLTYLAKDWVVAREVAGMPLHYFLVAVFVYPVTWIVFIIYVRLANRMEDQLKQETNLE